jgi:exopolysaccharide production protein ExoQ
MSTYTEALNGHLSTGNVGCAGGAVGDSSDSADRRLLWLAIVVLGAVFFFVGHNFQVSQYERYAPWSDADGTLEAAGHNWAKGLALSMIGLLGIWLATDRGSRRLCARGWLPALMVSYVAWSAASVFWSIDPGMSCRRLAVLMFCMAGAFGFARRFRPRDVAVMAATIAGAYLLVGVCTELALGTFRPWSADYRFAGTVHPNTQGANLAVLCLASFCLARSATRDKGRFWALFATGLIFLLLTKSRTSCAGLAAALAVLWWVGASGQTRVMAVVGAALVVCATALAGSLVGGAVDDKVAEVAMLGRQDESEALTGRIPLWSELANYIRARPLEGYGYEAFWTTGHIEAVSDEMEWPLREAHNAFIDGALSVGLIGVAAFLAIVTASLFRAAKAYRQTADAGFALTVCLLAFGLVDACLESGMMSPNLFTLIAGSGVVQLAFGGRDFDATADGCVPRRAAT